MNTHRCDENVAARRAPRGGSIRGSDRMDLRRNIGLRSPKSSIVISSGRIQQFVVVHGGLVDPRDVLGENGIKNEEIVGGGAVDPNSGHASTRLYCGTVCLDHYRVGFGGDMADG
jgi:hypothetical protein